jgi:hypothetical protein
MEEKPAVSDKEEACCAGVQGPPELSFVRTAPGLELGNHAFLKPLPACCAQIASPYWARVIGDISNNGSDEVLIHIAAVILDKDGVSLGEHTDFMVLEPGARSEFDIKISTFYDDARAYGLEVTETHDF